jgi:hypothetical protein
MHLTQQTSLFAFQNLTHLGARQKAVYDTLRTPMTDKQIAEKLGWEINCVCGRRNELVKMGMVRKAGVVKQDGRSAILWEVGSIQ